MILVDTSIWVGHLRNRNELLSLLLEDGAVLTHEFVIGELTCGSMRNRRQILALLENLPRASTAAHAEVVHLIESRRLHGRDIGWIDAHLLASAVIAGVALWTSDRKLRLIAESLDTAYRPE